MITIKNTHKLTGEQILKIRQASGLSQRKFVAEVGVSRGNLWRIERYQIKATPKVSVAISSWAIKNGYAQKETIWQKIKSLFQ